MTDQTNVVPAYDVAIIGYGPTGVTAANLLGGMGLRVLVVERDADIYARARAISTDEEVMRIWQSIGLAERLQRDMLAGLALTFVDDRQRILTTFKPRPHGHGHPPQQFIFQPALEQVLRDGADRYANVEIRLEHECLRTREDGESVDLLLHDIGADALAHARARYVIAADGGASPTRGLLGVGFEGRTYEDRWVVIDTKMKKTWPNYDFLRFHCDPARPAVDCPTPLDHHRWEFPILPGEDETHLASEAGVRELLAGHGITDEHVDVLRAVVYSHHIRFASQWRRGRIFLAGDAAHVMPPWIGQGMAAGVRDAANLCWKLAGVLDGSLPESVLDSYEQERQPHVRDITSRAINMGRLITERRPNIARARDLLLRCLDLPPIQRVVVRRLWIPPARYATGFLAGTGHRAEGRQLPQPEVVTPGGKTARLDDALPRGWAVLHAGPAPQAQAWRDAGAAVIALARKATEPAASTLVDTEGVLEAWLEEQGANAVAVRPDRFVYAASDGASLPVPPLLAAP